MTNQLNEITINNEKTLGQFFHFLQKVSQYPKFDVFMPVRVYYNYDSDFIAFESLSYRLTFASNDHKLKDIDGYVESITFDDVMRHVRTLLNQLNQYR